MKNKLTISVSIVYFNSELSLLERTITCVLRIPLQKTIYIIDNSSSLKGKAFINHSELRYINTGKNIGFGAGHNVILQQLDSDLHLVLNPDVEFEPEIIVELATQLIANPQVALIAPKVIYPSGHHQYTCRRYPTLSELILRKWNLINSTVKKGEYRSRDLSKPFYPDILHGCFLLFRTVDFVALNGFDERFFLYMEDVDICRRIDELGKKKLYYPSCEAVHYYTRGSQKKITLFLIHILSVFKYFYKWKIAHKST